MLQNKVENKPIIQIDLEQWIPKPFEVVELDLIPFLYKELILKETEFRELVEHFEWEKFRNKIAILSLSKSAIVPQWAYLIISHKLQEVNSPVFIQGENLKEKMLIHVIEQKDLSEFEGKRVLIKGCGREKLSNYPYTLLTQRLAPIVKALSFGESCSMVPLFKN